MVDCKTVGFFFLKISKEVGKAWCKSNTREPHTPFSAAVYKSGTGTRGQGHWDACVGTWDLGTRGEGRGDIWYGTRDVWDAGTCGTGTRGRQM